MSGAFLAESRIVFADTHRVYVASGYGAVGEDFYAITALDVGSGEVFWQREDLAGNPVDDVFLQGIFGNTLVVSGQYHTLTAVDSATGETLWSFDVPEGYGAVGSVAVDDQLIVTAQAPGEGDIRPPLVYALDLNTGAAIWATSLAEGTDLQWRAPAASGGFVVVSSTLSHPGSATGNMVHAVDVSSGEIRWSSDLGGEQGFHTSPTLISGGQVLVRGPNGMVAFDLQDGNELWRQGGLAPLALRPDGSAIAVEGEGLVVVDPNTGDHLPFVIARYLEDFPWEGVAVRGDQLITTSRTGVKGYDLQTGELLWLWNAPSPIVDVPAMTEEFVVAPTEDRAVSLIQIP